MSNDTKKRPDLIAYTVTGNDDNAYFHRIGAAWANKKGGYGIRLHALPVNGEIVLLPPKTDADSDDSSN